MGLKRLLQVFEGSVLLFKTNVYGHHVPGRVRRSLGLRRALGRNDERAVRDALNANTDGSLSAAERDALVARLNGGTETRATALRKVAEDVNFRARETNPAFVLLQYFGYLRRNPEDPPGSNLAGYNFWLTKLNSFGGDFRRAGFGVAPCRRFGMTFMIMHLQILSVFGCSLESGDKAPHSKGGASGQSYGAGIIRLSMFHEHIVSFLFGGSRRTCGTQVAVDRLL